MSNGSLAQRGLNGIRYELRTRMPFYLSDWTDGLCSKVLAASLFLFFACMAPAVAFGGMMAVETQGQIGVVEMILATAVCGVTYSMVAGQPLTILGGTGPLLVFTGLLFGICQQVGIPFLTAYAWIGLWSGGFLILWGCTSVSRLIGYFTRFTDEIFSALISLIFISEALKGLLKAFPAPHVADDSALLGLLLAVSTCVIAIALSQVRDSPYLRRRMREFLADFGPALAVLAMVGARGLLPNVQLEALSVPEGIVPSSGRPWLVEWNLGPAWLPWACLIPGFLVAILLFLDQNITTRIIQAPRNNLKKGDAYHWDLVLVGGLIIVCSIFGLPWLVAATVRSINHLRALETPEGPVENRVSAFLVHLLIGLTLFASDWLRQIPVAVLFGLFLYMGLTSLRGNQLFLRLRLWIMDPKMMPEEHYLRIVSPLKVHAFTAVQVACLAGLYLLKSSSLGILFPLMIAALVPIRSLLNRYFSPQELAALDSEEDSEQLEDDMVGP